MADSGGLPISVEREREKTIEILSTHFANDNLSLDELERRIEAACRATSASALRDLTKDLPTADAAPAERRVTPLPEPFAPERDRVVSIMSETKRHGVFQMPRVFSLWGIMSDTRLDLTEATLAAGVTDIRIRAIMAAVKVIVPAGVRVVVQPTAFMSAVADDQATPPAVGSGPVIRITGSIIMSELSVKTRTREE